MSEIGERGKGRVQNGGVKDQRSRVEAGMCKDACAICAYKPTRDDAKCQRESVKRQGKEVRVWERCSSRLEHRTDYPQHPTTLLLATRTAPDSA
eukprot:3681770-Rhodomonas_salina.1